jgi:hypothetical protein
VTVTWVQESSELGAVVNPQSFKTSGDCFDECWRRCNEEFNISPIPGAPAAPPMLDVICAAKCYDDSGCASLPYKPPGSISTSESLPVPGVPSPTPAPTPSSPKPTPTPTPSSTKRSSTSTSTPTKLALSSTTRTKSSAVGPILMVAAGVALIWTVVSELGR